MKIGSLFTGYGGLDMAVSQVTGTETVWVSDVDKGANKILAHRYPDVPNLGDITRIDWQTVEPVDILTGGFPCQDLSHAGKRAGLKEGTRSGLWSYMADAIEQLQPRLVVAENVRGFLSAQAPGLVEPCPWCVGDEPVSDLRALGTVLADLADIGYDAKWCGLRAADVGACHGRFRVFLIAHPADSEHVGYQRPVEPRQRSGVPAELARPTAGDLTLLPTPAVNDMGAGKTVEDWDAWTDAMKAKHGNGNGHGPSLAIEAQRLLPTPGAAAGEKGRATGQDPAPRRAVGKQVELADIACFETDDIFGKYATVINRHARILGRPAPPPTELTGKGNQPRLSARFVEWMMGLPDGWVTDVPGLTRNEALKALGNGVVPLQAETALAHLLEES